MRRVILADDVYLDTPDEIKLIALRLIIPAGSSTGTFTGTTTPVAAATSVVITAFGAGSSASGTAVISPVFPAAVYSIKVQQLTVAATTSVPNSTLTFGVDPNAAPLGTMRLQKGVYTGQLSKLATTPSLVVVFNSNAGSAIAPVTVVAQ